LDFYFVACHDYDESLEIQSTSEYNFKFNIPRSVEPGIIKIFDIDISEPKQNELLPKVYNARNENLRRDN
jgi:hypothetical protein